MDTMTDFKQILDQVELRDLLLNIIKDGETAIGRPDPFCTGKYKTMGFVRSPDGIVVTKKCLFEEMVSKATDFKLIRDNLTLEAGCNLWIVKVPSDYYAVTCINKIGDISHEVRLFRNKDEDSPCKFITFGPPSQVDFVSIITGQEGVKHWAVGYFPSVYPCASVEEYFVTTLPFKYK